MSFFRGLLSLCDVNFDLFEYLNASRADVYGEMLMISIEKMRVLI